MALRPEHERIFREIYEGNEKWLYQNIARQIGDPSNTEDILQEVAVAFLFRFNDFLPGYPGNAKQVEQWLLGVARNKVKHYWRKHYRALEMEASAELLPNLDTGKTRWQRRSWSCRRGWGRRSGGCSSSNAWGTI